MERLRDSAFVTYSLPEGLPADGSNPLFVDSHNRTWFAPVDGGLLWMKDGKHGSVHAAGLTKTWSIRSPGGMANFGSAGSVEGFTELREEQGSFRATSFTQAEGLAQDSVYSVYQSRMEPFGPGRSAEA